MSTVQRIARNTAFLLLSNVASFILGFFFTMYVARHLGAEGFGVLSFALALTAIFGVFADIGLQMLMIREIARDRALAQKYLGNIAVMKICLAILTFGMIALTINLLGYPQQTVNVVYLLGLAVILNSFVLMFSGVFRAYERMEFEVLGGVLGGALTLAIAIWGIRHDFDVVGFACAYVAGSAVTLGYCFAVGAWRFVLPRIEFDLGFWKSTVKQAWPFALAGLLFTIYFWIDSVMLSLMKGDDAVGWYNGAFRLTSLLVFVPGAYFGAIFPIMSRFHVTSSDFLRFAHERSFKYMLILGVPIGAGTTILANKIIILIFGLGYLPSVLPLQILIWSTALAFVGSVFANLFQSVNRQIILAWILAASVILKVILNLILIPGHSYAGASVATVGTAFVALVLDLIWSSRIGYGISFKNSLAIFLRVSFASAIMSVLIVYVKSFYILALVPISALLYFAVLYIIGGIDRDDLDLLRSIVGRRPPNITQSDN